MDKLRRALSGNDSEEEEESCVTPKFLDVTKLSWSKRIKGFVTCFVLGIFCSLLASSCLFFMTKLTVFAVLYTFGNLLSIASTCFLMGPFSQVKKMFAPTRVIATILVIVMIAMTLFAAIGLHNGALALLFVVLQSLAMTWYTISYIPFAREVVKKTASTCIP